MKRSLFILFTLLSSFQGMAQQPALIPQPSHVVFGKGRMVLEKITSIQISDSLLSPVAHYLNRELFLRAKPMVIQAKKHPLSFSLIIQIDHSFAKEEYSLSIVESGIQIKGSNEQGIFFALQTLRQLVTADGSVPFCTINDKPAFPIRGYMVDVGRNYQSVSLLKKQIDVMAHYKLNLFHLHLTEDIAWRIQSDLYPSLHAPENMLRDKGKWYTFNELNELAKYCRDRSIIFMPEIDMPGHSAAFKRATGFDMQSPEGKKILYQLLDEFIAHVPTEYFHVGGDEVNYSDKNFLTEVSDYILSKGKKVMAWDPGGQTGKEVIRQLWNGSRRPPSDKPSVDSRHLYLNHFDPLEGVVATFNHSILDADQGDSLHLGAILCNWPDRKVNKEEDVIIMNAVYPTMLAFAERTWNGGGFHVLDANMGVPGSPRYAAFQSFEKILLEHKKRYFASWPFPYQRQTDIDWTLLGPFPNQGDLSRSFPPEEQGYLDAVLKESHPLFWGGTIWLRHFWDPVIQSHLKNVQDSSTWYAFRNISVDSSGYYPFWIGFNNISRSPRTPTPLAGTWDDKGSKAWVNGTEIAAPKWEYPGRIPHDLEDPLYDEGYEYREPSSIFLNKGQNKVLLKLPVGSFRSTYDRPVKWMFTFVQLRD